MAVLDARDHLIYLLHQSCQDDWQLLRARSVLDNARRASTPEVPAVENIYSAYG